MAKRVFTETWIKTLKPHNVRRDFTETGRPGFMLRVWPGGQKTFVFRYHVDGRARIMTLGQYPVVNLAEAHDDHAAARKLLAKGIDPIEEQQRQERAQKAHQRAELQTSAITARNVIAEWGWHYARRHRKRPREAVRLLRSYLEPWEGKPARDLVKRDAVLLLDRIVARGSLVAANRIRDLASQAFTFAVSRDLVQVNPFLGVPKPGGQESAKERTLNSDEIRTFWRSLDSGDIEMSPTVRLALRLILATAQRPGEVIGAAWSEFDLDSKAPIWRIPAARSKNGKPHDVPLSDLALEQLSELRALAKDRPCIAPSVHSKLKPDEPLSERALSRALRNNYDDDGKLFGLQPFTPHDLRRTAATSMTALGIARLHVAKVLNHVDGSITAVYDRHDYEPQKRLALQTWADDLRAIIAGKKRKVLPIRPGAAA
jgi:integrase